MAISQKLVVSASEERLWQLIEDRLDAGADRQKIDARIWDLFGETWAVMFTDLSGFSRRVAEFGIIHFLQIIHESQRLLIPVVEEHDGFLLKIEGDSFLVIFRNSQKAYQCAETMNAVLADYNQKVPAEDKVLLCVGLGYGEVLRIGDTDVWGAEVNAASKLGEDTAKAGDIMVTDQMKQQLAAVPGLSFESFDGPIPGTNAAWYVRNPARKS